MRARTQMLVVDLDCALVHLRRLANIAQTFSRLAREITRFGIIWIELQGVAELQSRLLVIPRGKILPALCHVAAFARLRAATRNECRKNQYRKTPQAH